jgi:hypothetical protein
LPDPLPRAHVIGLPDGLAAEPTTRPDGTLPRDRRQRLKITEVTLRAAAGQPAAPGDQVAGVSAADLKWAVSTATRRWTSITSRFGGRAPEISERLCRAGIVTIRARVDDDLRLGAYLSWAATPEWATAAGRGRDEASADARQWRQRAHAAADGVEDLAPSLAGALRAAQGNQPRLPVLIYAAEDLAAGVFHDGPRAFSQTHFGDTKAHDDVATILTNAGATTDVLVALGIRRSPYIGLGGPFLLRGGGEHLVHLAEFDGPIRFRVDQPLATTVAADCRTLLVIENLQAAEAVCDHYPDVAVIWVAGQPANPTLQIVRSVAHGLRVLIAPDADLGGVRIANRVAAALPDNVAAVEVLDVGETSHPGGARFGANVLVALSAVADGNSPAAGLAAACLRRGYRVEQEALIRAAVGRRLESHTSRGG